MLKKEIIARVEDPYATHPRSNVIFIGRLTMAKAIATQLAADRLDWNNGKGPKKPVKIYNNVTNELIKTVW